MVDEGTATTVSFTFSVYSPIVLGVTFLGIHVSDDVMLYLNVLQSILGKVLRETDKHLQFTSKNQRTWRTCETLWSSGSNR